MDTKQVLKFGMEATRQTKQEKQKRKEEKERQEQAGILFRRLLFKI